MWAEWQPRAQAEYEKQAEQWEKNERARLRRLKGKNPKKTDAKPAPRPTPRMHPNDSDHFLKLACALKIILARSIKDADMPRAKELLYGFLQGFLKVVQHHFFAYTDSSLDTP